MTVLLDAIGPGIARVTIRNPAAANAMTKDMDHRLEGLWRQFEEDGETRVVILTGAGPRHFCAGVDLGEMVEPLRTRAQAGETVRDFLLAARTPPKGVVVVAALNGATIGGGFELALSADIRIAAETAYAVLPETKLGVIPGAEGTVRLPRLCAPSVVADLILTGRKIGAHEMKETGLVSRIHDPTELQAQAVALSREIIAAPPEATRSALNLLRDWPEGSLDQVRRDREAIAFSSCLRGQEVSRALESLKRTSGHDPHPPKT